MTVVVKKWMLLISTLASILQERMIILEILKLWATKLRQAKSDSMYRYEFLNLVGLSNVGCFCGSSSPAEVLWSNPYTYKAKDVYSQCWWRDSGKWAPYSSANHDHHRHQGCKGHCGAGSFHLTDQLTYPCYLELCIEKVTNAGYCLGNETSELHELL